MDTMASGWRCGLTLTGFLVACGGSVSREPAGTSSGGRDSANGGNANVDDPPTVGGTKPSGTAGKGGRGSAGAGGRAPGTAGTPAAGADSGPCRGGQIPLNGMCACPPYAPNYCANADKCVNSGNDPEHCGDCDTQCGLLNACSAGVCTPNPNRLGVLADCGTLELQMMGATLYGITSKTGTLFSFAVSAGGGPVMIASDLNGATAFAIDASNAYVAAGSTVTRVNLATGAKTVLVSETATIFDVAVANGKIFYATGKYIERADATAPSIGVSVATAVDEGAPQGVTISGNALLYVSNLSFNVELQSIVGDEHVKVGASQGSLLFGHRSIQADASNAYWANVAVQSAPLMGPDHLRNVVAQPIDGSPTLAFAVDPSARMAYLATEDGRFEKSTFEQGIAGEEATAVLRGLTDAGASTSNVTSIVLDDTSAYIASGCSILQTPR